ncbi:hypothetical protein JQ615_24840 [Bradyrhizobium jicamae]|uniref:Transposase n=1 Tax=Bradyrhizobium jicamae TaxID=280332 RepID=A0ABS5FP96_9BRAD|nr:hypothetical protein [Bradyrhizobium jicamae]MBR0798618.1 hypothetical protein [Bradyrhizobium jicamae]MBR0934115.1 hypothetical protein [Bradyrhizobium jicamae]
MTAQSAKPQGGHRRSSSESHEEVARSLERELNFLAEERRERALELGLDIGAPPTKVRE